jgi:hypothetical protein
MGPRMLERIAVRPEEYVEALGFSTYTFLTGKIVKLDLYKGGAERLLGEYLEHLIRGKLSEIALKKFLLERFGIECLLDLNLPTFIKGDYLPDILAFKTEKRWIIPKFWIEVKAVQEHQKWSLIRASSLRGGKRRNARPYDAYVNAMVHLPKNHLGRLIKHAPSVKMRISKEWLERLQDLECVEVDILGFALYEDMTRILKAGEGDKEAEDQLDKIFGSGGWAFIKKGSVLVNPETGRKTVKIGADNCAITLSSLRATENEWKNLVNLLKENRSTVEGRDLRAQGLLESQMETALKVLEEKGFESWFRRALNDGQRTLNNLFKLH